MIGNTRFDSPSYHIVFHAVPVRDRLTGPYRLMSLTGASFAFPIKYRRGYSLEVG